MYYKNWIWIISIKVKYSNCLNYFELRWNCTLHLYFIIPSLNVCLYTLLRLHEDSINALLSSLYTQEVVALVPLSTPLECAGYSHPQQFHWRKLKLLVTVALVFLNELYQLVQYSFIVSLHHSVVLCIKSC